MWTLCGGGGLGSPKTLTVSHPPVCHRSCGPTPSFRRSYSWLAESSAFVLVGNSPKHWLFNRCGGGHFFYCLPLPGGLPRNTHDAENPRLSPSALIGTTNKRQRR